MLELTSRCNLRCRHCYHGAQDEQQAKRALERDTQAVKTSLEEWADAGCLNLLITGGDPMMRTDFAEIYRHACELGMVVTVFCDGILVSDSIIDLFRELPPRKVEVSIYGATAATYEDITRVPGSHARAWEGIRRLHGHGVRIALKTMLLTLNQHELEAMAAQAAELGCSFRFDAAVFPCIASGPQPSLPEALPGGGERRAATAPLDLRVPPEDVVRFDMLLPDQRAKWTRSVLGGRKRAESDLLYPCGAGATSFYADPYGTLSPCLMTRRYRYSGQGRAFGDVWRKELAEIRSKKRTRTGSSFSGVLRGACAHCPAFNELETGDEETESDHMRTTARLRYEAVMATEEGVDA
jgi:MoaA/NifB/PqqE/SkfB family radical SAM enzyme